MSSYGMRTLVMIMAGGQGSRLQPLTKERAKPAVYFAGKYRIIDFVLNNFVNSGFYKIKVLTQFKSDSLIRHISTAWSFNRALGHFVDIVPAQMRTGENWYRGTADAIFQNLNLVKEERCEFLAVFGGDHIYKMEVNQLVRFHEKKGGVATVAAIPVPVSEAHEFGIIEVDENWKMVGFVEKPKEPKEIPGRPGWCLASMGNYVWNTNFLIDVLESDSIDNESSHDFGKDILPALFGKYPIYVYDFSQNDVPDEKNSGFWKDVGTLDAYFEANMDVCAIAPEFNLYNLSWPLRTYNWNLPPAKFAFAGEGGDTRRGQAVDSIICEGSIISGATVRSSVISPNVFVHSWAEVNESILFPDVVVGRHAKIRRAILDKGISIPDGFEIGVNPEEDRKRFFVTESGITVIPKGTIVR